MDWIREIWAKWTFQDYETAKEEATDVVVTRLARNNVLFQSGAFADDAELDCLSREADKAIAELNQEFQKQ